MGTIMSLLRAARDVDFARTDNDTRIRRMFSRMAVRSSILLLVFGIYFAAVVMGPSHSLTLQCLGTTEPCMRERVFVGVYVLFFVSMFLDICLACCSRHAARSLLPSVAAATCVTSAVSYLAVKAMYYAAFVQLNSLQTAGVTVPSWVLVVGIVMSLVLVAYKSLCAVIFVVVARRIARGDLVLAIAPGLPTEVPYMRNVS